MLPSPSNATTAATTERRIYCPLMPQSNMSHLRPSPPSNADTRHATGVNGHLCLKIAYLYYIAAAVERCRRH
jgi:hypothetical protein